MTTERVTKVVLNYTGIAEIGRSEAVIAMLHGKGEMVAEHARSLVPRDADSDPHYVDMISVESGLDDLGRGIARVNANKYTSNWIEYGSEKVQAYAPLRRGAESAGLVVVGGK